MMPHQQYLKQRGIILRSFSEAGLRNNPEN